MSFTCDACGSVDSTARHVGTQVSKGPDGRKVITPLHACARNRRCRQKIAEQARMKAGR